MPAPARTNYVEPAELAALVRQHRTTGTIPAKLAEVFVLIAGGVWDRYRFTDDREDFTQEVALHLMGNPLKKADIQKHVFNYFTTCAIRYGFKLRDKQYGDRRRFQTYAAELAEAGRPIPDKREHCDATDDGEHAGGCLPYRR